MKRLLSLLLLPLFLGTATAQTDPGLLNYLDVFELEYASSPAISPDGKQIVYVRNGFDVLEDKRTSNLYIVNADGSGHRPLATGPASYSSPSWSPDGSRLIYVSSQEGSSQVFMRWMDDGQTAKITNLTESPSGLSWSPDGEWLAFSMTVPGKTSSFATMPTKPAGAKWNDPPIVVEKLSYRSDGRGYVKPGYRHLFVLPASGGSPRQVTSGDFNHSGQPSWSPDGGSLIFSANRHENWEYETRNTEVFELDLASGSMTQLTSRFGPDSGAKVSPDGKLIAFVGYDDTFQGYSVSHLYVMDRDGSRVRSLTDELDRSIGDMEWDSDSKGLFLSYTSEGNGKLARIDLNGKISTLASDMGGSPLGRPYGGGSWSVSDSGTFAYTRTTPEHPAEVAVGSSAGSAANITDLNSDLLAHKTLGAVEEIWWKSSADGLDIQGWIIKPPDFDPGTKYPLLLEIHGGPFADYGDRFTAELQLFAKAGYVVFYTNPRGSTSYGGEFGNLIHHNYPGEDYDDLISGVDAVIEQGYVDEDQLYVTGGSGGGVLSSWIIGKTDRFRAAVVAKPVINWTSFALTADGYATYYKYWFPGVPWENHEHYWKRSPLSLVGNVNTPTMLLTGESDLRTPMGETEQYYQALKLRKVPTAMVRIPGAPHGITGARPSNLVTKVVYILEWFDRYKDTKRMESSP